jgi:hypothetical protein
MASGFSPLMDKTKSVKDYPSLIVGIAVVAFVIVNIVLFQTGLDSENNQIRDNNYKHFIIFNHVMICTLLFTGSFMFLARFAASNMQENEVLKKLVNLKPKKWFQLMIAFLLIAFLLYKLIHYNSNLNDPVNTSLTGSFKVFLLIQHVVMVLFILWAIIQLLHIIATGYMLSPKNYNKNWMLGFDTPNTALYFHNSATGKSTYEKPMFVGHKFKEW